MDLGFRRLEPSEAVPVAPDYQQLVASLLALQAASPTATIEAGLMAGILSGTKPVEALIALFAGAPEWAAAIAVLEGAFHPECAAWKRASPP